MLVPSARANLAAGPLEDLSRSLLSTGKAHAAKIVELASVTYLVQLRAGDNVVTDARNARPLRLCTATVLMRCVCV
jgi:hypothetical protein